MNVKPLSSSSQVGALRPHVGSPVRPEPELLSVRRVGPQHRERHWLVELGIAFLAGRGSRR